MKMVREEWETNNYEYVNEITVVLDRGSTVPLQAGVTGQVISGELFFALT